MSELLPDSESPRHAESNGIPKMLQTGLVTICRAEWTREAVDLIDRTRLDVFANDADVAGSQHIHEPLRPSGP